MIEYGYIYFLEIRTTLITVFGNDFLIEKLHTPNEIEIFT